MHKNNQEGSTRKNGVVGTDDPHMSTGRQIRPGYEPNRVIDFKPSAAVDDRAA
jgi:hypothetical protein